MIEEVITELCNLITIGDEVDRCYAAKTLGQLKNSQAIPTLIKCLRDEDVDVTIDAIEALGNIGNPIAVPALLESLTNDPDGEVKTAVVEALTKINAPETINPLLKIAQTNPEDIIWDETNEWNAWWDMQLMAVQALGIKKVQQAVPILATILTDEEGQDIESEVLTALAQIGGAGEEILINRLTTGNLKERRRAATALSLSTSQSARKALALALADKKVEVRIAAIKALEKQNATMYFELMLRFLQDPEPEMRKIVIDITIATPEQLTPLLDDPNPNIISAVLKALSNVTTIPPEALVKIRSYLTNQNDTVIIDAALLLANLQDQSIFITLLQILSDTKRDKLLRSKIATALGMLGNLEAVSILTWTIGDQEQIVRLAALNALMQLANLNLENLTQTTTPLEIIIATLNGKTVVANSTTEPETPETQDLPNTEDDIEANNTEDIDNPPQSTLEAITRDNKTALDKNSTELLQNSELEDVQEYMTIAEKNIKLGEQLFIKQPVNIANDVRYLSATVLGDSDKPEAIMALITVLNDDDLKLRQLAINALGYIAKRSPNIEELTNATESLIINLNFATIRLECIRTLGYLGGQSELLLNYLQDPEPTIRIQTIESLTDIDIKHADKFVELLQDVDMNVRKVAAIKLTQLQYINALDAMIDSAIDGAIAREIGKCLRSLDKEQSSSKLLQKLPKITTSEYRRFVIEMLEEVWV